MSITAKILSSLFLKGDIKRDAGLVTPENIQRIDDLYYGNYREQILDVYKPKDAIGKLPIIVSVHGGGWVYGDKERYQYYCMDLASRGFAVINFSYRLAPQAKWPSLLEDTNLVFHWIKKHSEEYGLDINHLFALGDLAGAHLLSLYCIFSLDKEYAMQYAFKPFDMVPKAIALNCGVYDVTEDVGSLKDLMKDLLSSVTQEKLERISPLYHLTKDFPPSLIMTASKDQLKIQSEKLRDKMDELSLSYQYKEYDNEEHTLGHVFHLNIRSLEARKCNDEECDFFRSFITKGNGRGRKCTS